LLMKYGSKVLNFNVDFCYELQNCAYAQTTSIILTKFTRTSVFVTKHTKNITLQKAVSVEELLKIVGKLRKYNKTLWANISLNSVKGNTEFNIFGNHCLNRLHYNVAEDY
jgi:hypothetical protein